MCISTHSSLKTMNTVQTPFMFSRSVQSPLQPAGFVFCYYFVRFLVVKWTLSAAMCDCSVSFQVWPVLLISILRGVQSRLFLLCSCCTGRKLLIYMTCFLFQSARYKLPGCSGCKHSPCFCAVTQDRVQPTRLPETVPVQTRSWCFPCWQVQLG